MSQNRRISKRHMIFAGAGVAALAAGTLTISSANAAEETSSVKTLSSTSASSLASKFSDAKDTVGSYYDAKEKKLVVNVVSDAAKEKVEAAGAEARTVENTMAELKSTMDAFGDKDRTVGTARAIDAKTNKVVVTADESVKGEKLADLKKQIEAQDGKADLKRSNGKITTKIAGGDAIYGGGSRCSLGFNVTVDGESAFLTAGHCTEQVDSWSEEEGGEEVAATEDGSFPGDDYGLAKYTGETDAPSEVNLYDGGTQAISGAGEATEGQQVTRSGSTTQVHDGQVVAVDATVEYPEGTVEGLIQTDVCAEPGDSGGSLFAEDQALGMTSGGSGDCSAGGETYFQPVTEALDAYGAEIG